MTDRVVDFAEMVFRLRDKKALFESDRCPHRKVTLDDNGGVVTCNECKATLSPYWALRSMAEMWHEHAEAHRRARASIAEDAKLIIHLRAARKIELAWKRNMAPLCPHCRRAVLPEDGMGDSSVSLPHEAQRRRFMSPTGPD